MSTDTVSRPGQPGARTTSGIVHQVAALLSRRAFLLLIVILLLAMLFGSLTDGLFLTPRNLSLLLRQSAILAVIAAGVAVLMTMSEIDLSIGSAVFLCGVLGAKLATDGNIPLLVVVVATVLGGVLLGVVQAVWVVVLGIPSFVATLAGLLAFRGIGLLWTDAATVGPLPTGYIAMSESFIGPSMSLILLGAVAAVVLALVVMRVARKRRSPTLGASDSGRTKPMLRAIYEAAVVLVPLAVLAWIVTGFQGIPMALVWVFVVVVLVGILMSRTRYGRGAYLLGANREAAKYSGIPVKRTLFIGFMLMGALYGVAGLLLTARLGAATPGMGEFMELDAIAAAVIGGVSLRGGIGGVGGAVLGAILLTLINNGMSMMNMSSFAQLVVKGLILILALALDTIIQRRLGR